ncbi:MAG: hypothetical protein ABSE45_10955 [Candidatus Acidiferrales bacterium]|jgi:hypothetical protein
MEKQKDLVGLPSIKRGDYVKSKQGRAQPIGVVWDIHPKNIASVEVYFPVYGQTRLPREYEPGELVVVPANEVSPDLVKFKDTMKR